jgi:hypothetical protein
LLQYFISSTVLLMMFEAIAMYRDIVLVFHSGKPFIKSALIISWGEVQVVRNCLDLFVSFPLSYVSIFVLFAIPFIWCPLYPSRVLLF